MASDSSLATGLLDEPQSSILLSRSATSKRGAFETACGQRLLAVGKQLAFTDRLLKVNDVLQVGFLARRETLLSAVNCTATADRPAAAARFPM